MLSIKNLKVSVEGNEILKGLDLEIKPGEVHAIMGPNGSGKSTLSATLAGREEYEVTEGEVSFKGKDLLELDPEDRAGEGGISGVPVPGGNSRRQQPLLPADLGQCGAQVP
ncbi:Probable ATP-dependent transporter SufC [Serratia entomophila]|nr:Probable ATP-dependent transporter SufC [Serratia entomophila]